MACYCFFSGGGSLYDFFFLLFFFLNFHKNGTENNKEVKVVAVQEKQRKSKTQKNIEFMQQKQTNNIFFLRFIRSTCVLNDLLIRGFGLNLHPEKINQRRQESAI